LEQFQAIDENLCVDEQTNCPIQGENPHETVQSQEAKMGI